LDANPNEKLARVRALCAANPENSCDPPATQLVQHVDNDPLPAASIDNPLDKLTFITQRLKELATRAIRAAEGDNAAIDMTLPNAVDRGNKILAFDANGSRPSLRLPVCPQPSLT